MKILISFFAFLLVAPSLAQNLSVDYVPNKPGPYWYGETIEFSYEYELGDGNYINLPQNCSESFSVSNNQGGTTSTVGYSGDGVDVTWGPGKSTNANLNIILNNCSTTTYDGIYPSADYTILSITEETPAPISGSGSVPVCGSGSQTYSTDPMPIPHGLGRAADGYEWTIPSGWKFSDGTVSDGTPRLYEDHTAFEQDFTPDCSGEGDVEVRAWTNAEGNGTPHFSKVRKLAVTRSPELTISTDPETVKCGMPFTATVTDASCATGYNWSVPSGWQISGTGNSRTITPSSTSGTVSVTVDFPDNCDVTVAKEVETVLDPVISGPDEVCSTGNFQLTDLPTGSSVTWNASPSSWFTTSSGTGNAANLNLSGAGNGEATITFNIDAGACGQKTVSKNFSSGLPKITAIDTAKIRCNRTHVFLSIDGNADSYDFQRLPSGPIENRVYPTMPYYSDNGDYFQVRARANNSCGNGEWEIFTVQIDGCDDGGGGCRICNFVVYPNPSSDEVNIELEESEEELMKSGEESLKYTVKVFDINGNEVHSQDASSRKTTVNVSKLKKGFYYLHLINKEGTVMKKIKVER